MPADISGGLPGSMDAKHSRKMGFDTDLHALMCGHQFAALMLAVSEWYRTLWRALNCHKFLYLVALTGFGSGVDVPFDPPVMLGG